MNYITHSFSLTENQKKKLARAYNNNNKAVNIKFKSNGLSGDFPIMITKRQKTKIDKAIKEGVGFVLRMRESQVRKQSQNGGFLGALAGLITKTIIPFATKVIPKIIAPLATGALTSVGDVAMKKIMGNGIIDVPSNKKNDLIMSNNLTKAQINKLLKSPCQCQLKLTKKQSQNGGFLGLLASLGIPLISSLIGNLMGKCLQIERSNRCNESRPRTVGNGLQINRPRSGNVTGVGNKTGAGKGI